MRSVNKVILVGNLTRDPEVRQTPNGQCVTTFGIATNREWVTRDGQRHTSSEYHELVAWSKLAEISGQYLKKGKLVYIEGYLKTRSWDTPEGVKKFKTEIVIQDLIMLDKREHSNIPANDNQSSEEYVPEMETESEAPQHERPQNATKPAAKKAAPTPLEAEEPIAATPLSGDIDQDLGL